MLKAQKLFKKKENWLKYSMSFWNLGINENLLPTFSSETTVESIIAKFENHPSIVTIRNCFDKNSTFSVKEIFKTEVFKEIKILTLIKNHFLAILPLR